MPPKKPERRKSQFVAHKDTSIGLPGTPAQKIYKRYDAESKKTSLSLDSRKNPHKYQVKKKPKRKF